MDQQAGTQGDAAKESVRAHIETLLGHEINLQGQRMTWLVISQSFLFGAWAHLFNPGQDGETGDWQVLTAIIPAVGLLVAVMAMASTWAAMRVINELVVARDSRLDPEIEKIVGSVRTHGSWTRTAGDLTPVGVPPVFATSWFVIVVQQYMHPLPVAVLWIIALLLCIALWALGFGARGSSQSPRSPAA